jgi:glycerol-3-phosphate O-acyltransferase
VIRKFNRSLMVLSILGVSLFGTTGCVTPGEVVAGVNLGLSWAGQILRAWGVI